MQKANYYKFNLDELQDKTFEEKIAFFKELGKQAKQDFSIKYKEINKWFNSDYDQLYILSFCMRYFMMFEKGYDEEAETGQISFPPHYLEILQAIALSHERVYSARPLWNDIEKLREDMKEIGNLIQFKSFDFPDSLKTIEDFDAYKVRTDVMGYHLAVRNWAYHHQMKKVTIDMANLIRLDFIAIFHADPVDFIKLQFALCDEVEIRVNKHIQLLQSAIKHNDHIQAQETYQKVFDTIPSCKEGMERFWEWNGKDIDNLRAGLIAHSDIRLDKLLTFSIDELVTLANNTLSKDVLTCLFDKLSYQFGDLRDQQQEHIILDNPVHDRPFIKIGEFQYYSSLWTIIPHLTISMLENLVMENGSLKNKYYDRRAKYLEDQVELLFRNSFPKAQIFKGSIYGEKYENDLLIIIDSFALVVEAKSGNISKSAKRGTPDSLNTTIKGLVEKPSDQALRFIEYLKANKGSHTFITKSGTKNHVDTTAINYFIPIGVTFYHFGVIGANLKLLIKAGITDRKIYELAPSISLTDLQVIFDMLETEAQKIHYLQRRREFETQVEYIGDELDLLGFYLDTGFNIGDMDNDPNLVLYLLLKSKELDPYYLNLNDTQTTEKPSLKMTAWWKDILSQLSKRGKSRWIEFSYILLNLNIGAQEDIEECLYVLVSKIKKKEVEERHNWLAFYTAKEERRYVIVVYPYLDEHRDERDEMIQSILGSELEKNPQAKGIVVIGVNIEKAHYPYSVVVGHLSVQLFDDQFSSMSTLYI